MSLGRRMGWFLVLVVILGLSRCGRETFVGILENLDRGKTTYHGVGTCLAAISRAPSGRYSFSHRCLYASSDSRLKAEAGLKAGSLGFCIGSFMVDGKRVTASQSLNVIKITSNKSEYEEAVRTSACSGNKTSYSEEHPSPVVPGLTY